jgi:hypothetical protein
MARRMERNGDPANPADLAIGHRLQPDRPKAVADYWRGLMRAEILAMTGAGMVGMAMRDQGAVHRTPGVDVKITSRAEDAPVGEGQNG